MDVDAAAERIRLSLWRQVLPFEARMMLLDGKPLTLVRELYPLAPAAEGLLGTHWAVQQNLLHLLNVRLLSSVQAPAKPFWEMVLDACDLYGLSVSINDNELGRVHDLFQLNARFLTWAEVSSILTAFDEQNQYASMLPEFISILYTITWWLLCEDSAIRRSPAGVLGGRYAAMFMHLLQGGKPVSA